MFSKLLKNRCISYLLNRLLSTKYTACIYAQLLQMFVILSWALCFPHASGFELSMSSISKLSSIKTPLIAPVLVHMLMSPLLLVLQ